MTDLFTADAILFEEVKFVLLFGWPLAVLLSILLAPRRFFLARPYRIVVYVLLGPVGTLDLVRRAILVRAGAATSETRPIPVRRTSMTILILIAALLATGIAMAFALRWPDWYFPVLRLHRALGIVAFVAYFPYLAHHLYRTGGAQNLLLHGSFSVLLLASLLFLNPNTALPAAALAGGVAIMIGIAVYVRRLDRHTEEGKSRGGLILNAWVLMVLATGIYLVPEVNSRISNNSGNYYYQLHGLLALLGLPAIAFLFLHHLRRTPLAIPSVARSGWALASVLFAALVLYAANLKTHAGDLDRYRNQRLFATATAQGEWASRFGAQPPHEWWLAEMNEVESCAACHDVLFEQWQGSSHALSGRNTIYRAVLARLIAEGRLEDTGFCQSCHQPALAALSDRSAATSQQAMEADQGVSCKACHLTYKIADPPRNGMTLFREEERIPGWLTAGAAYQPPPDDRIRDDLRLHLKSFSNSKLFGSPAFCGNCHRIELPATAPRHTTVVLPNPYDTNGTDTHPPCKTCHMPYDTRNARGVQFPNHNMFGANPHWSAMLPAHTPPQMRQAVAKGDAAIEEWLAGLRSDDVSHGVAATWPALKLHLGWENGPPARLVVNVENSRGGHAFPVAAPDLVETWLFVEAIGADGRIFTSGALDAAERLTADAHRFGVELLDGGGEPLQHHDILGVGAVGVQRLLVPGRWQREEISIPESVTSGPPVDVRVELRSRRAKRELIDGAFGRQAPSMPIASLAVAHCRIAGPGEPCR